MNKYHSLFSLLFFFNTFIAMDKLPSIRISATDDQRVVYKNTNEEKNYLQQRRIPQNRPVATERRTLYSESKIRKPQRNQPSEFQFIYDQYTSRRGAPKMLNIHCDGCNDLLIKYQKDGPGRLLRCYQDRIHAPIDLKNRQHEPFNVKTSPNLSCSHCRLVIGRPMIYQSESRPAYHLVKGSFWFREN